jgi:very-short-patch-repair endonuclease
MKRGPNVGQLLMAKALDELKLSYAREVQFYAPRKWRFDFVVDQSIAIEVDGYYAGHHGTGFGSDNEKQNVATMMGFRCLRFSTNDVKRGKAKAFLQEWLR